VAPGEVFTARLAGARVGEVQEQQHPIAVGGDGIGINGPLVEQVVGEELLDQGGEGRWIDHFGVRIDEHINIFLQNDIRETL
jgi:hypothetical protein